MTPQTWLQALRELDPEFDLEAVAPGVTVPDLIRLHDRVVPPAGFRYDPAALYASPDGLDQTMHLYAPEPLAAARPGVLFVHGGGWAGGCATWHLRQACALAELGYVAATMDYRLAPEHRWPAPLDDVRGAVQWLRANAERLSLDPERLVVAGGSAGGHLAALAALEPANALAGAILWYPAVDLRHFIALELGPERLGDLFGEVSDDLLRATSPTELVHSRCPPVLTLCGDRDELTPPETAAAFHRRLAEEGVENRLVVYPGKDHQFDLYPGGWEDSFAETVAFLDAVVGPAIAA